MRRRKKNKNKTMSWGPIRPLCKCAIQKATSVSALTHTLSQAGLFRDRFRPFHGPVSVSLLLRTFERSALWNLPTAFGGTEERTKQLVHFLRNGIPMERVLKCLSLALESKVLTSPALCRQWSWWGRGASRTGVFAIDFTSLIDERRTQRLSHV